jgi:hypothetical protein
MSKRTSKQAPGDGKAAQRRRRGAGQARPAPRPAAKKTRSVAIEGDHGMDMPPLVGGRLRGMARRAMRVVVAPVAFARAVVDLLRRERS